MECAIPHKVNLFLLFTTCVGNLHFVPQASQVAAGPPRTERGRNYLCMLIPYLPPPTLLSRILKGLEQNDFSFFFTLVISCSIFCLRQAALGFLVYLQSFCILGKSPRYRVTFLVSQHSCYAVCVNGVRFTLQGVS